MTETFISWGMDADWAFFIASLAGVLLIALPLMLAVAMIIYVDRKVLGAIMLRRGPNVVGPFGLLQSFADGLKVFLQETIIPSAANKGLFLLAPIITFTVALAAWAVIPFNSGAVLADINVGLLYVLAISSLGVYGVVISGWASNSKYPFFSAMRAAAQMISYEVSIGFILVCVVLWAGTFNLNGIIEAQRGHGFGIVNAYILNPFLFPMWVLFFISSLAETARAPFDLTEAESELVAGYQTEYSSMSFALFWLGEYANILLMCMLNAILFFGGWLPPIDWEPLYLVPGWIWLFAKTFFFFFMFSWIWATVPRYRYDQLMRLGWKVFLPISLLFIVLTSGYLMMTDGFDKETTSISKKLSPTSEIMASLGATEVCPLYDEKYYQAKTGEPEMFVYMERLEGELKDLANIKIKSPDRLKGDFEYELLAVECCHTSGSLTSKTSNSETLHISISNYNDTKPSIMTLTYKDARVSLRGDCTTVDQLKALS